jgi:hypothetical protein
MIEPPPPPPHKDDEHETPGSLLIKPAPQKDDNEPPSRNEASPQKGENPSVGAMWTQANTKYKPGEPMLSEEDLRTVGPSCQELHNHYMLESANSVENIGVQFDPCHFETEKPGNFYVGFNDLYDLFNL